MQLTKANGSDHSSCTKECEKLQENGLPFITNFNETHDISRKYFKELEQICEYINTEVYNLKNEECVENINAPCKVIHFFNSFVNTVSKKAEQIVANFNTTLIALLKVETDFATQHDLRCDGQLRGCKLNELRCLVKKFIDYINSRADVAQAIVSAIVATCQKLVSEAQEISKNPHLLCNVNGAKNNGHECTKQFEIEKLVSPFEHNAFLGFQNLTLLGGMCNEVSDRIEKIKKYFETFNCKLISN